MIPNETVLGHADLKMGQNDSPLVFGLHLPLVRLNAEAFGALIAPHSIKVPD